MKHIFITICFTLVFHTASHAQQNKFEAIESEKIAYITKELKLTPSEAQKFFPIYNKYNEELWNVKQEKRGVGTPQGVKSLSGTRRDVIAYDAKELEIKKKYRSQFTEVVGQARSSQFFQVVEDFNDILRNELRNRRKQ